MRRMVLVTTRTGQLISKKNNHGEWTCPNQQGPSTLYILYSKRARGGVCGFITKKNTLESHFLTSCCKIFRRLSNGSHRFRSTAMDGETSHQGNNNNASAQQHSSGRPRSRGPDCFLITCRGFGVVTALAAILCIAVNVISAIQSFWNGNDIFDGIFRCYAVIVGIFVVIAETEWEFFLKFSKVLQYWVGRGMLQIFVAVMTRAYPEHLRNHQELFLLQSIAAYLLLGCGVIYIISGLFCLNKLKSSHKKSHVTRDQAIKDLEHLQRRREELEALLIEDQA